MLIYVVTNKVNGKRYVGQTIQRLEDRWSKHCSRSSGCPILGRAIRKYGRMSFTVEVVSACSTLGQLNDAEAYFVDHYQSMTPDGYNVLRGGDASHSMTGVVRSQETRERFSAARKGKPNGHLGLKRSDATRARQSVAQKGNQYAKGACRSVETRAKIGAANRGRPLSDEQRWRLSQLRIGKSPPNKGVPMSSEAKLHLSKINAGKRPGNCVEIVNTATGELFYSMTAAARNSGISVSHLSSVLSGRYPNRTNLTPVASSSCELATPNAA